MMKDKRVLKDKVAGAVYGFAVGDSMGATTEFMSKASIQNLHGTVVRQIGGGWLNLKPGEVTDDTQMTLCIMNVLMDYGTNISVETFKDLVASKFLEWYHTGPKDIGNQCARALDFYEMTECEYYIDPDPEALGNGSLMRAMPCAILGLDEFNEAQGRITHNNDECSRIIQTYSEVLQDYLMDIYVPPYLEGLQEPSGCIRNTFNNAMWWSSCETFRQCIIGSVNDGGDADTISAIAGSLAGARFGLKSIHGEWIAPIDVEIKKTFGKFIDFSVSHILSR